jgi:hypothetical protein
LFDRRDLFLVEDPAMRENLLNLGCPDSKTAIQRIVINMSRITPQYPARDAPLCVLMVGRFVEKKDFRMESELLQRYSKELRRSSDLVENQNMVLAD